MSLTFNALRAANRERQNLSYPECASWSLSDWGNALAGEAGELSNKIKKLLCAGIERVQDEPNGFIRDEHRQMLASELADIITYADLLADSADIDLESAVVQKFNEVSKRKSSPVAL